MTILDIIDDATIERVFAMMPRCTRTAFTWGEDGKRDRSLAFPAGIDREIGPFARPLSAANARVCAIAERIGACTDREWRPEAHDLAIFAASRGFADIYARADELYATELLANTCQCEKCVAYRGDGSYPFASMPSHSRYDPRGDSLFYVSVVEVVAMFGDPREPRARCSARDMIFDHACDSIAAFWEGVWGACPPHSAIRDDPIPDLEEAVPLAAQARNQRQLARLLKMTRAPTRVLEHVLYASVRANWIEGATMVLELDNARLNPDIISRAARIAVGYGGEILITRMLQWMLERDDRDTIAQRRANIARYIAILHAAVERHSQRIVNRIIDETISFGETFGAVYRTLAEIPPSGFVPAHPESALPESTLRALRAIPLYARSLFSEANRIGVYCAQRVSLNNPITRDK
jgi:hypothetical protein